MFVNRCQAIISTNADLIQWRIYEALGKGELILDRCPTDAPGWHNYILKLDLLENSVWLSAVVVIAKLLPQHHV